MLRPRISFFIRRGLAKSTLKGLFPKAADPKQAAFDVYEFAKSWDYRSVPSKIFSQEITDEVRQRRIFAIVLLSNYAALRKSTRLVEGRAQANKNPTSLVIDTLCIYYNAYLLTLEDCSCLQKGAALGFNSSVNLIKGFNDGKVILDKCPCGKPLLLRVQGIYTGSMNVKRDFFRCPWCNRMDNNLKAYLEERLYASEQWLKRPRHK